MSGVQAVVIVSKSYYDKKKQLENIPRATRYQLTAWGSKAVRALKAKGGGGVLKTRTGHLRRNIDMRMKDLGPYYILTVGTGPSVFREKVKYAQILDRGGTILPRQKKMLTIPLGKTKGWARNYDNTFIQKSKKGNLLIFQNVGSGKKRKIKPLFLLKDKVTIPAKRWFSGTIKRLTPDRIRMMSKAEVLKVAKRL